MTPRQAELLTAIKTLTRGEVSPSFDELSAHMGVSKGNIHRLMERLRDDGYIADNRGRKRSLTIVDKSGPDLAAMSTADLMILADRIDAELEGRGY